MSTLCTVSFPETKYLSISLMPHENLSEYLTLQNSPVLFGCRTGICGTCLVEVSGNIPSPMLDEQEILDMLATDCVNARLACQLSLTDDIEIRKLKR